MSTHDRTIARGAGGSGRGLRLQRRVTVVFAATAVLIATYLYASGAESASACASAAFATQTSGRGLRIAQAAAGPWYEAGAPPLSNQIAPVVANLYPGRSGTMVAYVKNVADQPAAMSISFADLRDAGGAYPEPERKVEPRGDIGDLSANAVLTITYSSSLRPTESPRVVAQGTLRDLAARGRVFTAPVTLRPFSTRSPELGVWRVELAIPRSADNRIQGDRTSCAFVFGLTESR